MERLSSRPFQTWRYHAPEILKEEAFTEKADIWALGCIAYEMLNNEHPFPATSRRNARQIHGFGTNHLRIGRVRDKELAGLIDLMLVANVSASLATTEQRATDLLYLQPAKRISTAELLQKPMFREQRWETLLRK